MEDNRINFKYLSISETNRATAMASNSENGKRMRELDSEGRSTGCESKWLGLQTPTPIYAWEDIEKWRDGRLAKGETEASQFLSEGVERD